MASDNGGILTQAELNVLNANTGTIRTFMQNGGGLFAMLELNNGAGLTAPASGQFNFVPATSGVFDFPFGNGAPLVTMTAFGTSLGLVLFGS